MAENHTLRGLLKSLASFIGEGAGGLLPKLGWNLGDFNDFINRSETDTAWEGYHRRKKAREADGQASGTTNASGTTQPQKRPSDSDSVNPRAKKPRNEDHDSEANQNGFSMLVPMPATTHPPPSNLYGTAPSAPERNGLFSDLLRGPNGSPMFMPPSAPTNSSQYAASGAPNIDGFGPSYMSSVNMGIDQPLASSPYDSPTSAPVSQQRLQQPESASGDEIEQDDDPKKNEAYKLIQLVAHLHSLVDRI